MKNHRCRLLRRKSLPARLHLGVQRRTKVVVVVGRVGRKTRVVVGTAAAVVVDLVDLAVLAVPAPPVPKDPLLNELLRKLKR